MGKKQKYKNLLKAEHELNDRLWYQVKQLEKLNSIFINSQDSKRMKKIKKKYGADTLRICNPFQFGALYGKLKGIRYAMGYGDLQDYEDETFGFEEVESESE